MQIVIDIPEEMFQTVKNGNWCGNHIIGEAIRNGTPLPEHHGRQRIGHWEYVQYDNKTNTGNWHCSECRGICTEMHSIKDAYNYCPNCGSKMEVSE